MGSLMMRRGHSWGPRNQGGGHNEGVELMFGFGPCAILMSRSSFAFYDILLFFCGHDMLLTFFLAASISGQHFQAQPKHVDKGRRCTSGHVDLEREDDEIGLVMCEGE